MNITLEMVDQVIDRTGCSYKQAKEALIETDGDVLEAIVMLETKSEPKAAGFKDSKAAEFGSDIIEKLKEAIKKGNVTRVLISKEGKIVMDIPINAGIVGALFFTPAVIVSIITALATGHSLQIVKDDGEIIDFKDFTEDTISTVKEKAEGFKDKAHEFKDKYAKPKDQPVEEEKIDPYEDLSEEEVQELLEEDK